MHIKLISIFLAGIMTLNNATVPKSCGNQWKSSLTHEAFYQLEPDSLDVAYIGSSVVSAAIDPVQIDKQEKISSFNLGVMSQPLMGTYYWAKEVITKQHPKVIVLSAKAMGRKSEKSQRKANVSFNTMEFGLVKFEYALDIKKHSKKYEGTSKEVNLIEYMVPFTKYWTRLGELDEYDVGYMLGTNASTTKGFISQTGTLKGSPKYKPKRFKKGLYDSFEVKGTEKFKPNKEYYDYFVKTIEYCQANNTEVLIISFPDAEWVEDKHNLVQSIADKYKVNYLDMNVKSVWDEMGYDFLIDNWDNVHLNKDGAKKVSKYLGKYLKEKYKL